MSRVVNMGRWQQLHSYINYSVGFPLLPEQLSPGEDELCMTSEMSSGISRISFNFCIRHSAHPTDALPD